jgi:hypothetical protein
MRAWGDVVCTATQCGKHYCMRQAQMGLCTCPGVCSHGLRMLDLAVPACKAVQRWLWRARDSGVRLWCVTVHVFSIV